MVFFFIYIRKALALPDNNLAQGSGGVKHYIRIPLSACVALMMHKGGISKLILARALIRDGREE